MKKTRKILALGLSFVMMLGLCLTAGTVNATDDTKAVTVSTVQEFKDYYGKGKRNFIVTDPLEFHDEEHFAGVEITADENVTGNLLTFFKSGSSLTNAQITTAENTNSAIHIYECGMTINNLTVNHSLNNGGAPVLVNGEGSKAIFTGFLDMKLGSKSWYGVNVDSGEADFSGVDLISCDTTASTQSVVCLDNNVAESVKGLPYSTVKTKADGGAKQPQIAFVKAEDLADFITAKQAKDVTDVVVKERVTLNKTLSLNEEMTINCEGDGAFVAGENLNNNVVTVKQNAIVKLNNVKIETKVNAAKSGLHIYGGTVTAENLTIINENTHKNAEGKPDGGAAIVLNGGNLTLNGKTTFELGEDAWGGINIDNKKGNPTMTIGDNATIYVTSPEDSVGLYYVDADKQDDILISGENSVVDLPDKYTVTINDKTGTIDENGELKHIHEATKVPAKEATYDATGNIEYWECTECGKYFADAALTKEITIANTIIPKLEKPGQPEQPEEEKITITLKAIVDGKEINLEELGLDPADYILSVEKGIAFTADNIKVLEEMKESLSVDGYTFRGYFLDAKGTEALKADVPFNADATIYMIWDKEVDVTVTPNPGDTEKPNTDNTNKPEQKPTETDKTVKTDDSSNAALYGLMISLSVVGAGIVVLAKKREELLNK